MTAWERFAMAIVSVIIGYLVAVGIIATVDRLNGPEPVCHAPSEDSAIIDCDYRDGAWWQDP